MKGGKMRILHLLIFSIFVIGMISFSSASLTNSLEHYYSLENLTGNVIHDSVNLSGHASVTGNPEVVAGKVNNAINFSGDPEFAYMNYTLDYINGTINFWVRPNNQASILMGHNIAGRNAGEIGLDTWGGNYPRYTVDDGISEKTINPNSDISLTGFTMITIIWGQDGMKMWINGTQQTDTNPYTGVPDLGHFYWASIKGQSTYSNAVHDELGIWSKILSQSEINDLWNNGNGLAYPFPPPPLENGTFNNVNVTNDLTVGHDLDATQGFFDFLGSSISKIIKGWFTELVVEKLNVTEETYLQNTTCSLGQALTTDTKGLVSCIDIINVKSGSASVTEGSCTQISFNTAFSSTPVATGNAINTSENNVVTVGQPSTTGFNLCLEKVGPASSHIVYWTATNAGNP